MHDARLEQLARNLVGYSVDVQPGEKILVEMIGQERELLKLVVREIGARGGLPYALITDPGVERELLRSGGEAAIPWWSELDLHRMKAMDGYIGIRAYANTHELSDIPVEINHQYRTLYYQPVHLEQRVEHTKWAVLRYPNAAMAQMAGMSTEAFEDFYFQVCNLDYAKMSRAMDALKALMERSDKVRIMSPGTDISFSIRGMPAVKCAGRRNIPDGECYTAPVRDSVNGTIAYNTVSNYGGTSFERIVFKVEQGKIVEATGTNAEVMNGILDRDEGARYFGEFSFGFNPYIKHPMKDTLFDEKIDGSIHFTPGNAYSAADNGSRSSVHWDIVLIRRPEYGGGEIYLDGVLVRKDGRFVLPELQGLNPEQLMG